MAAETDIHSTSVRDGVSVVSSVRVDDLRFTALAVQHPSARFGAESRRADSERLAAALGRA